MFLKNVTAFFAPLFFCLFTLLAVETQAQIRQGKWFCIEAKNDLTTYIGVKDTLIIKSSEEYEAGFRYGTDRGRTKAWYTLSAKNDTLYTTMPKTIYSFSGSSKSTTGTKVIYDYSLNCTQFMWEHLIATALGHGWPANSKKSFVLIKEKNDSILVITSPDKKAVLTFRYGVFKPITNPVLFHVDMNVQRQLGKFNPQNGDIVVVRGGFNNWSGVKATMTETATPGVYQWKEEFPASQIDLLQEYKFAIVHKDGTELVEDDPKRSFILEGGGVSLPTVFFNGKYRVDDVNLIRIAAKSISETSPANAYSQKRDEFLVVWMDYVNENSDIYGRFVKSDGSTPGNPFPICIEKSDQSYPAVDYNRDLDEYMVVWKDGRKNHYRRRSSGRQGLCRRSRRKSLFRLYPFVHFNGSGGSVRI